eukprot:scaffold7039_cov118-Isochrysis_galbana.AAC.6
MSAAKGPWAQSIAGAIIVPAQHLLAACIWAPPSRLRTPCCQSSDRPVDVHDSRRYAKPRLVPMSIRFFSLTPKVHDALVLDEQRLSAHEVVVGSARHCAHRLARARGGFCQ